MLATARLGMPLSFVAIRGGISRETLTQWRAADPEFSARLDEARVECAEEKWKQILASAKKGTPGSWQALAWCLERSHPESFARPEIQLGVQVNSQTNVNNTLVVSMSMEVGEKLQARAKAMEKEISQLSEAYDAKRGLGNGIDEQIREVESELMTSGTAAITLPPPTGRHPNWWAMLSRGDGHRPITPEAATFILRTIATDTLGAQRAAGLSIDRMMAHSPCTTSGMPWRPSAGPLVGRHW